MSNVSCSCQAIVVAINIDVEKAVYTITLDLSLEDNSILASYYRLNLVFKSIDDLLDKFHLIAKASGDRTYSYQKACSVSIPTKLTVEHTYDSDTFLKLTFIDKLTLGINEEHGYFLVN